MIAATEPSIRLVTSIPGPRSAELLKRRADNVPRALGTAVPVFIRRAEGAILEDIDGNRLLDFTGGIGCQNAGHRPLEVVEAIEKQAQEFLHTCFMVTPYEGYVDIAEWLNTHTPGAFAKKTLLVNSGAEAVENAVKVARHYTKRQAIIAFEDAFHGRTQLALSLTGKSHPYKAGFGPFAPEVYRLPYAYCYRCPYNLTHPSCEVECAQRLQSMFLRHIEAEAVAAVIFEPVLGEGGFVVPPPEWFDVIARICRKHGILMIVDEIQTGFCRTGTMFASDRFGIEPDLIVTAKSLSGGLPLGAVTGRAEIMDSPELGGLGGTFGGNPVACAAALGAVHTMESQNLAERAEELGRAFEQITHDWPARFRLVGNIRGIGAMRAIELVTDKTSRRPAVDETKRVLAACHQRGLVIISAGTLGNVIRVLVPLVVTDEQFRMGMQILEQSLAEVCTSA